MNDDEQAAHDHAIARALDAEHDDAAVDEALVAEYQAVLSYFPLDEVPPRAEFEDEVLAAALARRPASVPAIDARRRARAQRARTMVLLASAVAAVIVVALLVANRSTSPSTPTGQISPAASDSDVSALLREPGTRSASFSPAVGRVVLAANGAGDVYELLNDNPVDVVLETANGSVALPVATPHNGVVAFRVTHPERVRAVRLVTDNGVPLGRALFS